MRWKLLFLILALLGALHFVASPLATRAFEMCSERFLQSTLLADKVSLDMINGQATFKNLKYIPIAEIRDLIMHWALLPLLSKQIVLEEISIAGATLTIPLEDPSPNYERFFSWIRSHNNKSSLPPRYRIEGNVVRYRPVHSPFTVRNVYLSDVTLRTLGGRADRPPLPSLTNLNISVNSLWACLEPSQDPMEFSLQTRLIGQEASYIKAEGSLVWGPNGLDGSCDIQMEGLDIAQLWPWINPSWLPKDFSQFQVTEGVMDLSSRVRITNGRWLFNNRVTLKKLKIRVDPDSPYRKIKGASPELVMQAINTLGQSEMRFGTYQEWRKAFEENVMKGVRNLIRQSIRDSLKLGT